MAKMPAARPTDGEQASQSNDPAASSSPQAQRPPPTNAFRHHMLLYISKSRLCMATDKRFALLLYICSILQCLMKCHFSLWALPPTKHVVAATPASFRPPTFSPSFMSLANEAPIPEARRQKMVTSTGLPALHVILLGLSQQANYH